MVKRDKKTSAYYQGIGKDVPLPTYPMGNPYISTIYPYIVGVYGLLSPRIPISTMGTLLGVHPIVP